MVRQQYYKVIVSGVDITDDIDTIVVKEKDGLFAQADIVVIRAYRWLEGFDIGNEIDIIAGETEDRSELIFSGFLSTINPQFDNKGNVTLRINALPKIHLKAGLNKLVRVIPSKNNKKVWGQKDKIPFSKIIENIARDNGFIIGKINVNKKDDRIATFTAPVTQNNKTDWFFMSELAKEIQATIWEEFRNGNHYFYCVSDDEVTKTIGKKTFYYLLRKGKNEFSVSSATENMIRLLKLDLRLDTQKNALAHNKILTTQNPKTGEPEMVTDRQDAQGKWKRYVFDEELLRQEPPEVQDKIRETIEQSMFHFTDWDLISKYFREVDYSEEASRKNDQINGVEKSVIDNNSNIQQPEAVTKNPNIRYVLNKDILKNENPEKRAELLAKSYRGELSQEEFEKYFKAEEIKKDDADSKDETSNNKQNNNIKGSGKGKKVKKNTDGFKITATCFGDNTITTKKRYFIEGIGKYSNLYYLSEIERTFGKTGYLMNLTFTK